MEFEKAIYRRWERTARPARYYEIRLTPGLFGWELVRCWGGLGSRRGRVVTRPMDSFEAGVGEIERTHRLRLSHGYAETGGGGG